mmetsp:Transcript_13011/g.38227  ORF Transcript_13011/g.38227 Transcript_13011/m.38227 type:complete len:156 (+) Transcript_13011:473-940(+)
MLISNPSERSLAFLSGVRAFFSFSGKRPSCSIRQRYLIRDTKPASFLSSSHLSGTIEEEGCRRNQQISRRTNIPKKANDETPLPAVQREKNVCYRVGVFHQNWGNEHKSNLQPNLNLTTSMSMLDLEQLQATKMGFPKLFLPSLHGCPVETERVK